MTNMIKQCPDGYMTCRRAEAGHGRCRGVCAADQPRTDKSILLEVSATLDKLLREKPNLGAFMGPYNSLGNLRIEVNRHLKESLGGAS